MSRTKTDSEKLRPIAADEVYPLEVFYDATGLNSGAIRTARRNGLNVRYSGARGFILGEDFIAYLKKDQTNVR